MGRDRFSLRVQLYRGLRIRMHFPHREPLSQNPWDLHVRNFILFFAMDFQQERKLFPLREKKTSQRVICLFFACLQYVVVTWRWCELRRSFGPFRGFGLSGLCPRFFLSIYFDKVACQRIVCAWKLYFIVVFACEILYINIVDCLDSTKSLNVQNYGGSRKILYILSENILSIIQGFDMNYNIRQPH